MSIGTVVGLVAVGMSSGAALQRALRPPRARAARENFGALAHTVRGRLWGPLNPSTRVDLFERGLVVTPSFLPRLAISAAEISAIERVKDARASGRRKQLGTRVEHGEGHKIAVELRDEDHATLVAWWERARSGAA